MSEEVKFKSDVVDEAFNSNKKKFISILPLNSYIHFYFFLSLIIFIFLALFFIQIPIKIDANGYIKNENKDIQVSFKDDYFYVDKIHYKEGDFVSKEQDLLTLKKTSYVSKEMQFKDNLNYINVLDENINQSEKDFIENLKLLSDINIKQNGISEFIKKEISIKQKIHDKLLKNYKNGLIPVDKFDDALINLHNTKLKLYESEQFEVSTLRDIVNLSIEQKEYTSKIISEKKEILDYLNDISSENYKMLIKSPCDCYVSNIKVSLNDLVEANSTVISLNEKKDDSYFIKLFIPTYNFGNINKENEVNIQVDSYPFLKFGTIKGRIIYISNSPSFDNNKKFKEYLIDVEIISSPENIYLHDGMTVSAHIITKTVPLYKLLFQGL